jgi:4-alpha-glucanotransferase
MQSGPDVDRGRRKVLKSLVRRSGVLLHPTSLPGPWGIGDLGPQAYVFIDFLYGACQQVWQVLPLGPAADNGSPYSAFSSTAGNPLLISLDALSDEGIGEIGRSLVPTTSGKVDYRRVQGEKLPLLKEAFRNFERKGEWSELFRSFCEQQADWLDDYALFMALKETFPGQAWNRWPKGLAAREEGALTRARHDYEELVSFHQWTQFVFYRQWSKLKEYAHERGIRVVGDIPFYVAFDSVDVWANPLNFELDRETGEVLLMAGVPPDYFSATGQLWGNPVYDFAHMERDGFRWWVRRFKKLTQLVDIVRIDHFRGFQAFWRVPRGETTAINGEWAEFPGQVFFHTLEHELGHLPVWAEDLGLITPEVEKLRDDFEFPGMKVLQFAYDSEGSENPYLPFNFPRNCVCYTGTHDNDTTAGWWAGLDRDTKKKVLEYVNAGDGKEINWALIQAAMNSVADTVVIPLQDILGCGSDSRMNTPGKEDGNWGWRFDEGDLTESAGDRLRRMTHAYGRASKCALGEITARNENVG